MNRSNRLLAALFAPERPAAPASPGRVASACCDCPRGALAGRLGRAGWVLLLLLAAPMPSVLPAEPTTAPLALERESMATFLYNFTVFVGWPASAFAGPEAPFVLGVLGQDPLGEVLDTALRGKTYAGRSIRVVRFPTGAKPAGCHLLFISRSEEPRLQAILHDLQGQKTLTVSDLERFAQRGGMIAVTKPQKRVQLAINLDRTRGAALTPSARFLSLKNVHIVAEDAQ